MNSRRGSTLSPMSTEKTLSASRLSPTRTLSRTRLGVVHRGLPQLLGVHLAEALVALDLEAGAAELADVLDEVDEAGGLGDDGLAAQEAVGARAEGRRVLADLQHLEDRVAVDEGLVEVLVLGDAVGVDLQLDGLAGAVGLVVDELGLQARERHARADGGDQIVGELLQRVGLQEHLGGLDGAVLEGVDQVLEHGGALAVAEALASNFTEDLGGDEVVADREAQVVDRVADDEVLEGALVLQVRPRCGWL
jgi:hypothetical protein